jgi:hypothetical protein
MTSCGTFLRNIFAVSVARFGDDESGSGVPGILTVRAGGGARLVPARDRRLHVLVAAALLLEPGAVRPPRPFTAIKLTLCIRLAFGERQMRPVSIQRITWSALVRARSLERAARTSSASTAVSPRARVRQGRCRPLAEWRNQWRDLQLSWVGRRSIGRGSQ